MTFGRRVLVAEALVIGVATIFSGSAAACRCREPSPGAAYKLADAVVTGLVESQLENGNEMITIIVVDRAWKRRVSRRIKVVSAKPCGYSFRDGRQYVVFLADHSDVAFGTRRCRGNGPLDGSGANAAVRWLRAHAKSAEVN